MTNIQFQTPLQANRIFVWNRKVPRWDEPYTEQKLHIPFHISKGIHLIVRFEGYRHKIISKNKDFSKNNVKKLIERKMRYRHGKFFTFLSQTIFHDIYDLLGSYRMWKFKRILTNFDRNFISIDESHVFTFPYQT